MKHLLNKFFNGHRLSRNADLPPHTIRVVLRGYHKDFPPQIGDIQTYVRQYDDNMYIWDIYKSSDRWINLFGYNEYSWSVYKVLGANTTGIIDMSGMFYRCYGLVSVPLLDTSSVIAMNDMFLECGSLTYIPLFNTSKVRTIRNAFSDCINVQSGALALYQQLISQEMPPVSYAGCFHVCGINTDTGRAELKQIPSDWK